MAQVLPQMCPLPRRKLGRAKNGTNSASNVVCDKVYSCKSVYAAEEKIWSSRNGTNSASNVVCDCKSVYAVEKNIGTGKKWQTICFKCGIWYSI